jgi:hypothetical protein
MSVIYAGANANEGFVCDLVQHGKREFARYAQQTLSKESIMRQEKVDNRPALSTTSPQLREYPCLQANLSQVSRPT